MASTVGQPVFPGIACLEVELTDGMSVCVMSPQVAAGLARLGNVIWSASLLIFLGGPEGSRLSESSCAIWCSSRLAGDGDFVGRTGVSTAAGRFAC